MKFLGQGPNLHPGATEMPPILLRHSRILNLSYKCVTPWFFFFFFFLSFFLIRAAPEAYRDSQARGQIRATAAGLHMPQPQQLRI